MFETTVLVISRIIETAGVAAMVLGFSIALILALSDLRSRTNSQLYERPETTTT